jgi:hypothetical protein
MERLTEVSRSFSFRVFLCFVIITVILFIGIVGPQGLPKIFGPKTADPNGFYCMRLTDQIQKSNQKANYCQTDKDCRATPISCPFDCKNLINNQEYNSLSNQYNTYVKKCRICREECTFNPQSDQIRCIDNKCTLIDSGS